MTNKRPPLGDIAVGIVVSLLSGLTATPAIGLVLLLATRLVDSSLTPQGFIATTAVFALVISIIMFVILWRRY